MKIAHLADIHIRLYKRYNEYKEVFERLYQSLIEQKVDRIAVVGDIVHSKSILSPELVELTSSFFSNLSQIAPVDIIAGNHDMNMKNEERLDALSPIVNNLTSIKMPVAIWEKSGVFDISDDVSYGIFSITDEANFPITFNKEAGRKYVALFHGNVIGSVSETNYVFKDSQYDSSLMFRNYDVALIGDIHRRQKCGINAWYPGSLIQQDFAESLDKGYLLWDTADLTNPVFVQVKNDYAFYNLKVGYKVTPQNMPEIQDAVKYPSIRLTLSNFDYTIAEIKQIEIELKQKYNPYSIEVKREIAPIQTTSKMQKIKSTSDVAVQNDLIKKFLEKVDPVIVDRVLKINEEIRNTISEDEIYQPNIWKMKELEWDNTFSYGQGNVFDFDKLKGITGIFSPNYSGKSNFIDTMLYTLFNKSSRTSSIVDMINESADSCKSSMVVEVNGELYRITRSSKRVAPTASTKVVLEKRFNGTWMSDSGLSRIDTDRMIRQLIGTFDDVIISNISTQGKIYYFLESGYDEKFRLELISKFLGLNIFKLQHEEAKRRTNEFEVLLKQFKQTDYPSVMKSYKDQIEKLSESLEDFEEDKIYLSSQSDTVKIQVATLQAMIQDVKEVRHSLIAGAVENDVEKIEQLHTNYKTQLLLERRLHKEDVDKLQKMSGVDYPKKISELQSDVQKKKSISDQLNQIESDIRVANLGLKKDRSRVNVLKSQPWLDETEVCKRCEFYTEADILRKELSSLTDKMQLLENQKKMIVNSLVPLSSVERELESIRQQQDETKRLESDIKIRSLNIEKFELQIEKTKRILEDQNKEKQKNEAMKEVKETNYQIQELAKEKQKELDVLTKQFSTVEYNILAHNRKISEIEANIQQVENDIKKMNELETQFNDYKIYLKCMHREGIPFSIISSYIDIINDEIHRIVGNYVPFSIRFSLDTEKHNILINIIKANGNPKPIELHSGMEKTISAIAIRAALASISNIPHTNVFIIDESFGTLDKEWTAQIDKLLVQLKSMFEHVILVSHVADVQDYVDQTITIDTSSGYSKLYVH